MGLLAPLRTCPTPLAQPAPPACPVPGWQAHLPLSEGSFPFAGVRSPRLPTAQLPGGGSGFPQHCPRTPHARPLPATEQAAAPGPARQAGPACQCCAARLKAVVPPVPYVRPSVQRTAVQLPCGDDTGPDTVSSVLLHASPHPPSRVPSAPAWVGTTGHPDLTLLGSLWGSQLHSGPARLQRTVKMLPRCGSSLPGQGCHGGTWHPVPSTAQYHSSWCPALVAWVPATVFLLWCHSACTGQSA